MRKIYLLFTFSLLCIFSRAQSVKIAGTVVDENNIPIPNVSVVLKSSGKGTHTNSTGDFSLTLADSKKTTILFSSTGYNNSDYSWNGKTNFVVKLSKKVSDQDEVVVIGYATVKRKDLLASVSSIGTKELKDIPINSAAEALNGRLAGVTATTAEGSPDAPVRIRVRGGMSITNDNSPLYIIDGVQVENGLSTLSPQDIQSIDVLKDAAATAIYGARGGNGVILITTKSGKQGKLRVSYNGAYGAKQLTKELGVLSPYDYVFYLSERARGTAVDSITFTKNFGSTWDTLANYKNVPVVDWQHEDFGQTGSSNMQNISASGGTKKLTYNFGYTLNNDKAIVINSTYQRHLFNLKADYKITSKIKIGVSGRYMHQDVYGAGVSDDKGSQYNRLRNAIKYRPFLSPNSDLTTQDPLADPNVGNGLTLYNPIDLASAEFRKKTTDAKNITAFINYAINKHINFKSTFGYDENKYINHQFYDSMTPYSIINAAKKPVVQLDTIFKKTITNTNILTYNLKGFRNKHDFDFLVGEETYDLRTDTRNGLFKGFPLFIKPTDAMGSTNIGTTFAGYPKIGKTRSTYLSFFSRINYGFKDKYLLSFNIRGDGSSKFAPGKQWGYFPAGSLAWRVSNEKFMKKIKFINSLKIRVGYGLAGNSRIDDYQFLTTFNNSGTYYYGINNQVVTAYSSATLVNEKLKWESTINKNLGVDITLFKNRIDMSVDIYQNNSKDLLLYVPVASTYGYTTQFQNIGKTTNNGIELQLSTVLIKRRNLSWSANLNLSHNVNKVVQLGVNQNSFYPPYSWGVSGQPADYITRIGDPVGSMWGLVTDGFYKVSDFNYNASTGIYKLKPGVVNDSAIIGVVQPGSIKFKDLNNDSIVDLNHDRKIIGNPTPKLTGGFSQQFSYKNWDISMFINFSYGNDIYNANKIELTNGYTSNANLLNIMQNRWKVVTPTGQTAQWVVGNSAYGIAPDQLSALNAGATIWQPLKSAGAFYPHSWAMEDGSFIRINNISIGYSLPVSKLINMHMSRLRFYATVNNVAVFTKYSGYDPEVSVRSSPLTPALDYSAYPKSRSYVFGINASF